MQCSQTLLEGGEIWDLPALLLPVAEWPAVRHTVSASKRENLVSLITLMTPNVWVFFPLHQAMLQLSGHQLAPF